MCLLSLPDLLRRLGAAACLLGLTASADATTFYVDSSRGADAGPGTLSRPWKSIERVNAQPLQPGDQVLFARGTAYVGALKITASGGPEAPIRVASYGRGTRPDLMNPRFALEFGRTVSVLGSHVVVDGLYLHDTPTPPPDPSPVPWPQSAQHKLVTEMAAMFVDRQAQHVTIRNCEFSNALIGIRLRGAHSLATHNYLHDAAKITEQWGAIAIAVVGPDNEVSYNRVENYGFYGGAFANDGAAVELDGEDAAFDGHGAHVHHNVSRNTKGGFLEIAANSHDVTVDHNVSDDVDKFIGTNGIRNLRIENNTIIRTRLPNLTQADFWSFRALFWAVCWNGCEGDRDAGVVVARNVFYLDPSMRIYLAADNPRSFMSAVHTDNLYCSTSGAGTAAMLGQPLGDGDVVARPSFRDATGGDFALTSAKRPGNGYVGAYPPGARWKAGIE